LASDRSDLDAWQCRALVGTAQRGWPLEDPGRLHLDRARVQQRRCGARRRSYRRQGLEYGLRCRRRALRHLRLVLAQLQPVVSGA
jgi:hypothetical protein